MLRFILVLLVMGVCGFIGAAIAEEWGAVGGLLLGWLISQPIIKDSAENE